MSSFVGLYTALSGIRAGQTGIDVASHNVANSATPGYTRQRVELTPGVTYQAPAGRMGTGVTVSQIGRLRDSFLDTRARSAMGDHGAASVRGNLLAQVEALTGEPDNGISARLSALWTAAEAWSNDPADPATRRQVLSELTAISETFGSVAGQWNTLEADVRADRDARITAVNDALETLAALDKRIANSDPSRIGSDLLDQRDVLLDDLAQLTGATARVGADGRSEVILAGVSLITPTGHGKLEVAGDGSVVIVGDGVTAPTTGQLGGVIGGLTRVLDQDLPTWRGQLDRLAAGLADAVNGINTGGLTADGQQGTALLAFDPADPARTLSLVTDDVARLAAGSGAPGTPPAPHDASNARAFADLRTKAIAIDQQPPAPPTTATLDNHFADLITGLAGDVRSARSAATAARSVATGAATARDAQHGVSIDEEMVELVRYSRALEAAARVMTTIDQALDVLVNRTGIVGR